MLVYHGSTVEVRSPRLLRAQRNLDFGKGFYTTTDKEQAASWAQRTARIRKSGNPLVSVYEVDESSFGRLSVLRFDCPNKEWLSFVADRRRGVTKGDDDWDVVCGPVANDQTMPTILLYLDGYLSADAAVAQLLPQRLTDQLAFRTERALALLAFKEAVRV